MFKSSSVLCSIPLLSFLSPLPSAFISPFSLLLLTNLPAFYLNLQRKPVVWPHWIRTNLFLTYAAIMQIPIPSHHIASHHITVSLIVSQYLKDFTVEIDGDISENNFWHCIMKYVNIWKICISQWSNTFQITNVLCHKIMLVKDPLKMQYRPTGFIVIEFKCSWYAFRFHIITNF